ncbi:hypothetical protein QFZ45_004524 [Pseudomonas synxantha]|nr:hypothetical protein [Pseudomonas synxantha]
MFSHEGTALELLILVFGMTGVLLIAWFFHHQYELRARKRVKNNVALISNPRLKITDCR